MWYGKRCIIDPSYCAADLGIRAKTKMENLLGKTPEAPRMNVDDIQAIAEFENS